MAANFLRAFDLASSDTREQIIFGVAERLGHDEIRCFRAALECLERRFDVLFGVSKASGAQLPHEIQLQIIDLLDITDIYYCTNVCRKWRCLLLESQRLTDGLLKTWFPALSDGGCDSPELLHQTIRRRHLRDTGRFRSKFTCGFVKKSNDLFPVDRVQGLQRGRVFEDLTCSASLHHRPQKSELAQMGTPHQAEPACDLVPASSAVSKFVYAGGRLAWQLAPATGEWDYSIIVHDFHAHRRLEFSLPSSRTRGIKLALWALGRDLVVARAVGERLLYAWDLISHAVDRVTLQNPPYRCFTRYRSVIIVTHSGELLLWSFGRGLASIDTAMPQDECDYQGPAKPTRIPREPFSAFEIQNSRVMFHPRDEDVFFMATFNDRSLKPDESLLLWVFEIRNKRCCRIFTYSVPSERRLWIIFGAQKVDAHGTYQLLMQENPTDDGVHISSVTFNTLSESFGVSRFQAPQDTDRDVSLVWNNQLILRQIDPLASRMRPCPLLTIGSIPDHHTLKPVADATFDGQTLERAVESVVISVVSPKILDTSVLSTQLLRTAIEASKQANPKYDVVRAPYISPLMPDLATAAFGLRYVLSLSGDDCNWKGSHVRACSKWSGPPSSEQYLNPLNDSDRNSLSDRQGGRVVAIVGDDDFLVVVTNRVYYTVFAVDEDGKIAEKMRDGATDMAEGIPREPPVGF